MKILHTSDWHLGQNFYTKSRKAEHQAFLDWLLQQVTAQQIDAVIVAGDIFDTATPPSYAREMYNQFVVDMHKAGCTLVVLGGNHDSVSVLNETKSLLKQLNAYVVANTSEDAAEQVIPLRNRAGEVGAILCAVPFIRARDVLESSAGDSADAKQAALALAIKQHYQRLYTEAQQLQAAQPNWVPIIATGHLAAVGVTASESVREIYIGTLNGLQADTFPPADYIALGHIHRPQRVSKTLPIYYSGSPVALSFDELNHAKQVNMLAFSRDKTLQLELLEVPQFQPLTVLKGDLKTLEQSLQQYAEHQGLPVWLSIEVTGQDFLSDIQQKVQQLTQNLPVEVLQVKRSRKITQSESAKTFERTLTELTPEEVFAKRLAQEDFTKDPQQPVRLTLHFAQTLASLHEQEANV
jgi:exonuclease SbcD